MEGRKAKSRKLRAGREVEWDYRMLEREERAEQMDFAPAWRSGGGVWEMGTKYAPQEKQPMQKATSRVVYPGGKEWVSEDKKRTCAKQVEVALHEK